MKRSGIFAVRVTKHLPLRRLLLLGLLSTPHHLAPVAVPPGRAGFYGRVLKGGGGDGHFAAALRETQFSCSNLG